MRARVCRFARDVYGFPVCNVRIICNKDDPITTKIKNASTTGPTVNFSLSFVEELMSTMPRLWMFELNFFCFACKTLLLAPACFLDDWIGLDWIFGGREKKRRETVRRSTKERSTNERTNERTNEDTFLLLLFLGLFFGARDHQSLLSIKNREQNRERSPTLLPRGTQRKEDFAPEERRAAKTRGCVHMHVCMHTHTHTQRERERGICAPCRFLSFVSARVVR